MEVGRDAMNVNAVGHPLGVLAILRPHLLPCAAINVPIVESGLVPVPNNSINSLES
jgi:hypothetical protein